MKLALWLALALALALALTLFALLALACKKGRRIAGRDRRGDRRRRAALERRARPAKRRRAPRRVRRARPALRHDGRPRGGDQGQGGGADGRLHAVDRRRRRRPPAREVVQSTEDGKDYRKAPYGSTMYVCGPPECDTFQIAGIRLEGDSMQRLASFGVDPRSGLVEHAGVRLAADPALVARMKAACAKEANEDRDL